MKQPRSPKEEELQQLQRVVNSQYGLEDEEARDLVNQAYIAVFENYVSGGPGYTGKVMVVVWDGGPQQYEVYEWNNVGEIRFVEQER